MEPNTIISICALAVAAMVGILVAVSLRRPANGHARDHERMEELDRKRDRAITELVTQMRTVWKVLIEEKLMNPTIGKFAMESPYRRLDRAEGSKRIHPKTDQGLSAIIAQFEPGQFPVDEGELAGLLYASFQWDFIRQRCHDITSREGVPYTPAEWLSQGVVELTERAREAGLLI